MKKVRVPCNQCGDVTTLIGHVAVLGEESYQFQCPVCNRTIVNEAARDVLQVLLSNGATWLREVDEDDIRWFASQLRRTDFLAALVDLEA